MKTKKIISLLMIAIGGISLYTSCEEQKTCKDCHIVIETYDTAGNIESVEHKSSEEFCDEELKEIENSEAQIVGDQKSYWLCN